MLEKVKYDVGTKVRAKIHYLNDPKKMLMDIRRPEKKEAAAA